MEDIYRVKKTNGGGVSVGLEFNTYLGVFDHYGEEFIGRGCFDITTKELDKIIKAVPSLEKKLAEAIAYSQYRLKIEQEESEKELISCGLCWHPSRRKKKVKA